MSRVTRQTGEIKVFQTEGTVSRGEEQRRVNGSQQRQGGRTVKGDVGQVGKAIACGASENTKESLSLARKILEANEGFKLSSNFEGLS